MMTRTLELSLAALTGAPVELQNDDTPEDFGQANIILVFGDGSVLRATYWRFIETNNVFSSFDHNQKYGLPSIIDAKKDLRLSLVEIKLKTASIDRTTGDLHFIFDNGAILQVFAFTGYEIWEITFSDGSEEYSNYARQ